MKPAADGDVSATPRPWERQYKLGLYGYRMGVKVRAAKFERTEDRDMAQRAVNSHDALVAACWHALDALGENRAYEQGGVTAEQRIKTALIAAGAMRSDGQPA